MCRNRLSSPRSRSELIDSAWVVIVPGQKCFKKMVVVCIGLVYDGKQLKYISQFKSFKKGNYKLELIINYQKHLKKSAGTPELRTYRKIKTKIENYLLSIGNIDVRTDGQRIYG